MAAPISPQPLVVGEVNQTAHETTMNNNPKLLYADQLRPKQSNAVLSKAELFPVTFVHGEPTVDFLIDDVNQFTREEGLHQAVIMKFSYGKPDLQEFRKVFSSHFDIKGRCNIGLLEFRHVLVRFDLYNDFVQCISKSTGYVKAKGEDFFFRTFPWTIGFNPKEEMSMAVVWISFPGLPPNFFAKRSLMSIASAVGKPIAVDKETQDRTRPSAARVKVILDLLEKHPKKIKIVIFDRVSGKSIDQYQEVVYDNLPKYCTYCKHQGHYDEACRLWKQKGSEEMATISAPFESNLPVIDVSMTDKLQGDARNLLNQVDARQAAVVQLGAEVKKQNDKAKGVTEVIDPSGELTTAGEGKKGNKEACLLGRVTGKESTKDQGNVSSSGKASRLEEKDDKHAGHPSLLNKQQNAKEKQNAHVKALPFTVGPSFKDMDAANFGLESSSVNGNPMAFNNKLVEGHGNMEKKKVMAEIEQKVDHAGHDSGQKDGNKGLQQLNNKTMGHLCLEIPMPIMKAGDNVKVHPMSTNNKILDDGIVGKAAGHDNTTLGIKYIAFNCENTRTLAGKEPQKADALVQHHSLLQQFSSSYAGELKSTIALHAADRAIDGEISADRATDGEISADREQAADREISAATIADRANDGQNLELSVSPDRASIDAHVRVQFVRPTRSRETGDRAVQADRATGDRTSSDAHVHVQEDRATRAIDDRASSDTHAIREKESHPKGQLMLAEISSAIISAEERKLLDSMEGNNVVSRDDRGYESNEELSTPEEVGSSSNLNVTNNVFIPYSRQLLINSGQKQMRLSSTPDLLSHDRQLLDAMLNADPFDILGRDPYSANRGNRSRNEVYRQQQSKPSYVKSQDEPNLDAQGVLDMPNQRTADNDIVVEGEVIEGLPQSVETVPINATEEQKSHTKEKSRDDNVRRPPMRNAKLKQAAPTTSTKSKRSKKKS